MKLIKAFIRTGRVDPVVRALTEAARTGYRGDGIPFVTPVERAIEIHTGDEGSRALSN